MTGQQLYHSDHSGNMAVTGGAAGPWKCSRPEFYPLDHFV